MKGALSSTEPENAGVGEIEAGSAGRRLRIGLLSEFAYPFHKGGAERRYYELASRLASRGHEVHWFAMRHWPDGPVIELDGITLHAAGEPLNVYAPSGQRSVTAGIRVGMALTRALREAGSGFDVLDCSLYPFFHIFGARLVRPRTPVVVSWYEFWGDHWYEYLGWRGFFGKRVEAFASRVPTSIISVSELAATGLASAGVRSELVHVVPLGVDTARAESVRAAPMRADVVSFGRLKNHKNIDLLLHAIARARESKPELTCRIIGDGPERARLERLSLDLGLGESVHFQGEVDDERDLLAFVKASKLFVNPSTKEGGGSLTLLEANACGLPAVAIRHDLGIDASLIAPGTNGWWVDRAEPDALAEAIVRALNAIAADGERAWADRCQSRARDYDWEAMTSRCEEIYLNAAARA